VISTESLLTSPDAFGIVTASPAQRAACRILDGQPLCELARQTDVLELVGGPAALAALPRSAPTELVLLAAIRTAKTILACAAAVRMTQTVDVSRLGRGEVPRVSLVSLKLDLTAVPHRILLGTLQGSPVLSPLLLESTADTITVRHPSGRPVEIAIVAGSKAGAGLVARWCAGAVFDEAPRMNGASDAVVNLDDARAAVIGRLLLGAQILCIGSPWAPNGPIHDLVQEHWRRPSDRMVVLRGTGPMLNPQWWTPSRCARLQEQDPTAYQTDVLGEFADPESGLINPVALRTATRESPLELEPDPVARYTAAIDPSEGTASANPWSLIIVEHSPAPRTPTPGDPQPPPKRFRVALAREWRGSGPDRTLQEIATICRRYRISTAITDQYSGAAISDISARHGLKLFIDRWSAISKLEAFQNLATLVANAQLELSPDRQLRRDLLSVKRRTTQQGVTIVLPKTGDGRHADYAPALASALKHASDTSIADYIAALDLLRTELDGLGGGGLAW